MSGIIAPRRTPQPNTELASLTTLASAAPPPVRITPPLSLWSKSASSIYERITVKSSCIRALTTVLRARREMDAALNPGMDEGTATRVPLSSAMTMADADVVLICSASRSLRSEAVRWGT